MMVRNMTATPEPSTHTSTRPQVDLIIEHCSVALANDAILILSDSASPENTITHEIKCTWPRATSQDTTKVAGSNF
jgi:hypothetical protein